MGDNPNVQYLQINLKSNENGSENPTDLKAIGNVQGHEEENTMY